MKRYKIVHSLRWILFIAVLILIWHAIKNNIGIASLHGGLVFLLGITIIGIDSFYKNIKKKMTDEAVNDSVSKKGR